MSCNCEDTYVEPIQVSSTFVWYYYKCRDCGTKGRVRVTLSTGRVSLFDWDREWPGAKHVIGDVDGRAGADV